MDRQQLIEDLKNALAHLNDVAMLADSPLATMPLLSGSIDTSAPRGVQLRNLLMELIEELRPAPGVPENAPEWRQYLILHHRYVLHKPLWEIEHRLTIGERQVRREHSRGLAILAEMLQARTAAAESGVVEPAATPQEAIERLTPVSRIFGLASLMEEVIAFLSVAGRLQEAQVQVRVDPDDLTVCTDPGILRQLLTRLLTATAPRLNQGEAMTLAAFPERGTVTLTLAAGAATLDPDDESLRLCQLLARTLGTTLERKGEGEAGVAETNASEAIAPEGSATPASGSEASAAETSVATLGVQGAHGAHGAQAIRCRLPNGSQTRKVLVIDDELAAVELFQGYVTGLDYQLVGETNAEEAVPRALELQPDAIVLDVMMPAMDGWEVLQRLRHTPEIRDVPIIVCSVLDESDLAIALGAAAFLKKPILRPQLVRTLNQVTLAVTSADRR